MTPKAKRKILKKYVGKGGTMGPSQFDQASTPINLLKAGPTPPTVADSK